MTNKFPEHLLPAWEGRPILAGFRGSRARNTHLPDSDYDYFAVWSHPPAYYHGIHTVRGGRRDNLQELYTATDGKSDLLVIDLPKFCHYLSRNSPDYHEMLWGPQPYDIMTKAGRTLHDNRYRMLAPGLADALWHTGEAIAKADPRRAHLALSRLYQAREVAWHRHLHLPIGVPGYIQKIREDPEHKGLTLSQECARLVQLSGKPTWVKRIGDQVPDWKFYNWLSQFSMAQEWGLTNEGRDL